MDATNRLAESRAAELERTIRDRIEKSRPKPPIEQLREQARAQSQPLLNPANRDPLRHHVQQLEPARRLTTLGSWRDQRPVRPAVLHRRAGHGAARRRDASSRRCSRCSRRNGHFYKVLNQSTIIVVPDTPQAHAKYDELVVRVFYLSHSDPTEISQILNTVMRIPTTRRSRRCSRTRPRTRSPCGHGDDGRRHRPGHPGQRQAARRGHRRRPDPRGQPQPGEGVRAST